MMPRRTGRGIVILSGLVVISFWLRPDQEDNRNQSIVGLDTQLNYALHDFQALYYDLDGRLVGRMESPLLTNDAETGMGWVEKPLFRMVHQENLWTILSESATVTPDRQHVTFEGEVRLIAVSRENGRRMRVDSSEVTFDIDPRVAHSEAAVVIREATNTLKARGFSLDMTNSSFTLNREVQGLYGVQ